MGTTEERFVDNSRLLYVFSGSFKVYFRQFPVLFIFSFLIELTFFGISQLVTFDIGLTYNLIVNKMIFTFEMDFVSELGKASFFILVVIAIILFIIRMIFISNITLSTAEKGKVKLFTAFESTMRKIIESLIFTLLIGTILVFPILLFIVALLIQPRLYYLAWVLFFVAMLFPVFLIFKLSHFVPGITGDNLPMGSALQKSWSLTRDRSFFTCFAVFLIFSSLSILGPWITTFYLEQTVHYVYIGVLLAPLRAFFYPLFDIAITLNYVHLNYISIETAVFREDIKKQKELSEKMIKFWTNDTNKR